MKKLDLWFDIDDVILNHTKNLEKLLSKHIKDLAPYQKTGLSLNFAELGKEIADKVLQESHSAEFMMTQNEFFDHAKDFLLKYHERGHDIHFITACHSNVHEYRENFFEEQFGLWGRKALVFSKDKSFVNGDLFVDDIPTNLIKSKAKVKILVPRPFAKPLTPEDLLELREHNILCKENWLEINKIVERLE